MGNYEEAETVYIEQVEVAVAVEWVAVYVERLAVYVQQNGQQLLIEWVAVQAEWMAVLFKSFNTCGSKNKKLTVCIPLT